MTPPRSPRFPGRRSGLRLHALLLAAALLGATFPTAAYESRGARSCALWQDFRQDEKDGNARNIEVYQTWLVGYLSGIVAGSGVDFLVGTENDDVFLMADAYCADHPQHNLAAVGTFIARSLMQQKQIVNPGTRP